jgi:hypothetical protein
MNQPNSAPQPQPKPAPQRVGFTAEQLPNSPIHVFTLTDITRPTVDTWIAAAKELLTKSNPDEPLYVVIDQSSMPGLTFSPYVREQLTHLYTVGRPGKGTNYAAVVLSRSFVVQIAVFFIRLVNRGNRIETQFFFKREEAVAWLQRAIGKDSPASAGVR